MRQNRTTAALLARTLLTVSSLLAGAGAGPAIADGAISESDFNRCRAIADDAARLRCFEGIVSESSSQSRSTPTPAVMSAPLPGPQTSQSMGNWRLVRTRHPQGGKDAVSIMRAADFSTSDPDFAGLMLRCGDNDVEVLIAVINPYPLRSHPHVTVQDPASSHDFASTVPPPGALVLLPPEATTLARTTWLSAPQISAVIEYPDHAAIKGTVRLDGLEAAFGTLVANCLEKGP